MDLNTAIRGRRSVRKYKKGAAIGAAAGAVAPHVSDRARNLTRLARMAWAFLGSRGGSFRY